MLTHYIFSMRIWNESCNKQYLDFFFRMNKDCKKWFGMAAAGAMLSLSGCKSVSYVHAPPGTSVDTLLAKKAVAVPTPTPAPALSQVNPDLPAQKESMTESVADYFTVGNLMMQQEKYGDAIKAYESAVKLDPTFSEAWNHLAICYQNTGQGEKAVEAFRKFKTVTRQQ
jgi:hypothetical protein